MQSNERCTWITRSHSRIAIKCKEMSGERGEGVDSAQDAHKNVKVPRDEAQSRPTHIYRRTPSNRAVIHWLGSPDASVVLATDAAYRVRRSDERHVSCWVKFPTVDFQPTDASVAWRFMHPTLDRRGPVRSKRRFSATWRVHREGNRHAPCLSSPSPAELLTSSPTDADARRLSLQHHRVRRLLLSSARMRVSHQTLTSASDALETSVRQVFLSEKHCRDFASFSILRRNGK
jgi:hypothetical protein